MDIIRQQQIEAVNDMVAYNKKLVKAVQEIIIELKGMQQPDTEDLLNQIVEGINWEIQVVNGSIEYINEDSEVINMIEFDKAVNNHNEAINSEKDEVIADSLQVNILPFLIKIGSIKVKE